MELKRYHSIINMATVVAIIARIERLLLHIIYVVASHNPITVPNGYTTRGAKLIAFVFSANIGTRAASRQIAKIKAALKRNFQSL